MFPISDYSCSGHCPYALTIALALTGVPALGATITADDVGGRSVEGAGTPTDAVITDGAVVVDPRTSRAGKAARGGTVKIETPTQAEATETAPLSNRTRAAQMVFIDPTTGEFTSSPPAGVQTAPLIVSDPAVDASSEGLEVVTHPDGSQSVDLQGRFQSHVFVTSDDAGKITVSHQPSAKSRANPAPVPSDPLKRQ